MNKFANKVFVLSLHRTGTKSTYKLLKDIGLNSIHNVSTPDGINYREKIVGLELNHENILYTLKPVINLYDAFSDVPFPTMYKTIHRIYPDARFIAVYRSPYDWLRSVRKHIGSRELSSFEKVQYWQYLSENPNYIDGISDEKLIEMHIFHYGDMLRYFQGKRNFSLFHLNDPQIGEKICYFLGYPALKFPNIDVSVHRI